MFQTIEHPLISNELCHLRDPKCPSPEFRQRVRRVASLMVPGVTADLQTVVVPCNTPLEITSGTKLSRGIILLPVLRAGLGFLDGFLDLIPQASVAHIGLARNETTLLPEPYYVKHPPELGDKDIIILDPMLATGGSASAATTQLKQQGVIRCRLLCLVAAPEGVQKMLDDHPDVPVFVAALDRRLNDKGYILPGLGDAGDRIFGTK